MLRSFKTAKIVETTRGQVFNEMNQFSAYPLQITRQASAHLNKYDRKFGRPLLERNSGSSEFVRAKRSSSSEEIRLEPVGTIEEYRDEASGTVVIAKRAAGYEERAFEENNRTVGK
jgi:hypothetical protein